MIKSLATKFNVAKKAPEINNEVPDDVPGPSNANDDESSPRAKRPRGKYQ